MLSKTVFVTAAVALVVALGLLTMKAFRMSSTQDRQPHGRQYFKSWESYQIPMRPTGPVEYRETEPLDSFYLATYDGEGRLARFIKYLVSREDAGERPLPDARPPEAAVYFEALPAAETLDEEPAPGREVSYEETEGAAAFFKGRVTAGGRTARLQRVGRRVFFTDEYLYWPDGKLKERKMTKEDGTVVSSSYDESGREVRTERH